MRGATETITVWHRAKDTETRKDTWTRTVIRGCSWGSKIVRSTGSANTGGSNVAAIASAFVVLIPSPQAVRIAPGDLVAKGEHIVEITGVSPLTEPLVRESLLPDVFTIKAVRDASAAHKRAPHYELTGV